MKCENSLSHCHLNCCFVKDNKGDLKERALLLKWTVSTAEHIHGAYIKEVSTYLVCVLANGIFHNRLLFVSFKANNFLYNTFHIRLSKRKSHYAQFTSIAYTR